MLYYSRFFKSSFKAFLIVALFFAMASCSGGGGGGGASSDPDFEDPIPDPPNRSLSGTISVPTSSDVDSDLNDTNAAYASNDSLGEAQSISNPGLVGGYVNRAFFGSPGRSFTSGDVWDYYKAPLVEGQSVTLLIGTLQVDGVNDLDLHLAELDGTIVDQSLATTATVEVITAPETKEYIIMVEAFHGASNYVLSIGSSAPATAGADRLVLSDDFVPGDVIVRLKDGAGVSAAASITGAASTSTLAQAAGAPTRHMLYKVSPNLAVSSMSAGNEDLSVKDSEKGLKMETLRAIKELRSDPNVALAEPNYIRRAQLVPTDEYYPYQWHFPLINAPIAWDTTTGSADVIVAVVDTGVFLAHDDLQGQLLPGYDFIMDPLSSLDGDGPDDNPDDPGSSPTGGSTFHGTHVAGTIAAKTGNTKGVASMAPGSKIMPVRVLGRFGGTVFDVLEGVRYAAGMVNDSLVLPAAPADIINLSLGGAGYSLAEQEVFSAVRDAGIIVVAAAGNGATDIPHYPAAYADVTAVSAVSYGGALASYSNTGWWIDVAGPGGDTTVDIDGNGIYDGVFSTVANDQGESVYSAYEPMAGTSMAAPHVAGVIALMKSVYPDLTPDEFDTLLETGKLTGSAVHTLSTGYGRIDAAASVAAAVELADGIPLIAVPTLKVSPAALNMGAILSGMTVTASNADGGLLSLVAPPTDDAAWLTVTADTVDPVTGLGTYTVTVDRTGLADGIYTATISFDSDANDIDVPLIMEVTSVPITGDAGYHYVLLVDPDTLETLYRTELGVVDGEYAYSFPAAFEGTYLIVAGSDPDNDGFICNRGEACGAYLTLVDPEEFVLDGDTVGVDFDTNYFVSLGGPTSHGAFSLTPIGEPRSIQR